MITHTPSDLFLAAEAFRASCKRADVTRKALAAAREAFEAAEREQSDCRRALLTIAYEGEEHTP